MPYSASIIKLLQNVEPGLREVLIAILEEIEKQREETVTKKEFNELKEIVKGLAEAQKKTEERLNELAIAQRELSEAQKQTGMRLNELAEAQKKTEMRLNELAEAQKKTEMRLNALAKAQRKIAEGLRDLIGEHKKTRGMLGTLQHTVGYVLEDRAFVSLPALLKRDYEIEITEALKREYIEISPRNYLEVNIIGKGRKDGQEVWILGECKSRVKIKDIDKFLNNVSQIEKILPGEKILVVVTYQTSKLVMNYIKEKGLKLYFSYEFAL